MSISQFFQRMPAWEIPTVEGFFFPTCPLHQVYNLYCRQPWWVTKTASWWLQEREQEGARRYLFPPIQNIEIQFIAGHMSQRKQLSAAVDLRGSNLISMTRCHWHFSGMSGNGLAWRSGPPVLVSNGWLWGRGPVSDGRKSESHFFKHFFVVVDGHFLVIAAPWFFLFLLLLLSPSGVLVTQLGVRGFDLCQLPWCKYSYLGYQPDVSEYGVGKIQDMHVIGFQEPARSLFQQYYTGPCLTHTVSRG